MIIAEIQKKIRLRQYEFSKHALTQSISRDICVTEIEQALLSPCEIIEDYPDDKYGPSCLVLGFTATGKPLHVLCSYPSRPLIKIVTLYVPSALKWIEHRIRH